MKKKFKVRFLVYLLLNTIFVSTIGGFLVRFYPDYASIILMACFVTFLIIGIATGKTITKRNAESSSLK